MCRGKVSQQHHIIWVVVVILGVAVAASIIFSHPEINPPTPPVTPRAPRDCVAQLVDVFVILLSYCPGGLRRVTQKSP